LVDQRLEHLLMAGVLDVLLDMGGGSAGGSLGPVNWTDIFDVSAGLTNTQTMTVSGGGTIAISATITGTGSLFYDKNAAPIPVAMSGTFPVSNGDTVLWVVRNLGSTGSSGTVTVQDATNSVTVDTFTYNVKHGT
jgi:hypothetical protein